MLTTTAIIAAKETSRALFIATFLLNIEMLGIGGAERGVHGGAPLGAVVEGFAEFRRVLDAEQPSANITWIDQNLLKYTTETIVYGEL